jgi:hypothetical protein
MPVVFSAELVETRSTFAIFHIVKITLLIAAVIFKTIFISLALIAHRSLKSVDILMLNVCVACMVCACFWVVYKGSWAPIYAVALADVANDFPSIVYGVLGILPNLSLLLATINLFLHDKRVKQMLVRFFPRLKCIQLDRMS